MAWIDANPYLTYYSLPSGAEAFHTGVDLNLNQPVWDSDKGSGIYAIGNGVVTYAGLVPTGTWGRLIVIRHVLPNGDIVHSRYGHMALMNVVEGQTVSRGDLIGTIGGAEWGMPNHLHFDISTSGILENNPTHWPGTNKEAVLTNYVNPKEWLSQYTPDPPPPTTLIDLLPYIKGDGTIYQMNVRWQGQDHRQQCQTQVDGERFYQVKNQQWEELWVEGEYILRGADTSPGDGMYYVQRQDMMTYGARWCPRRWSVGGMYERNPLVTFYESSTGRQKAQPESGYRRTWLKFEALHSKWQTHPNGLAFTDVAELTWYPKQNGPAADSYFYARNFGLVAWRSSSGDFSYTVEVYKTGEATPMSREEVAGL